MTEVERTELEKWAVVGAGIRLQELEEERKKIHALFPSLAPRATGPLDDAPASEMATTPTPTRKKRHMSTAARKRIAKRMKAYWKAKRNGGAG
jgi:hypothetical protein